LPGWYGLAGMLCAFTCWAGSTTPPHSSDVSSGLASWYGEEHRGKLMANGQPFDPDKLTAASRHYPLGTRVRVTLAAGSDPSRSVVVTITDRGPATERVRQGRIIDLSRASFRQLAPEAQGLAPVTVEPVQ
jgi:rare lipoprotein A